MTQKYEIGSQWETRKKSMAIVNEINEREMIVYHKGEGLRCHRLDGSHNVLRDYDLLRPWVRLEK